MIIFSRYFGTTFSMNNQKTSLDEEYFMQYVIFVLSFPTQLDKIYYWTLLYCFSTEFVLLHGMGLGKYQVLYD